MQVYNEKHHALEVRLRPEDRFCKPALAQSVPVTNMVLRVRRRKQRKNGGEEDGRREGSECRVDILGMVKQSYEFSGIHLHTSNTYMYVYNVCSYMHMCMCTICTCLRYG